MMTKGYQKSVFNSQFLLKSLAYYVLVYYIITIKKNKKKKN